MPGKVVRQVFIVNNAKPDKAAIQSQCKLNSAPEQTNDPEPKKLRKKTAPKVLRNRIVRPHIVKGRDIQLDDSGGEDVIETDWIAEADGADRPVVHEVQLVELLKPGKPGKPRPRDQQADDFEFIPEVPSVIVLDDQPNEPEAVEEDWETLELDEYPDAHQSASYAEVAAPTA